MTESKSLPNRKERRAERSTNRPVFAAGVERLKDMAKHSPWSEDTLHLYAKAGLLKTRKVGGSRVVLRQDWFDFINGTPDDADLSGETV